MARRAVINGASAPLRLEDCEIPSVPPNQVRIKVAYAGVCHTDLHLRHDDGASFGVRLRDAFGKNIELTYTIALSLNEILIFF